MPKEVEPTNHLIEDRREEEEEDEEDEEEDEDYDPDKDNEAAGRCCDALFLVFWLTVSLLTGSEIEEDDEIDDESVSKTSKGKSSKSVNSNNNDNNAAVKEASDGLVQIDEDKITLLWSEFCNDDKVEDAKKEPPKVKKEVVTKQYDFAGEIITVQEEVAVVKPTEKETTQTNGNTTDTSAQSTTSNDSASKPAIGPNRPPFKRPAGGLSGILGSLKKPKMSTLTKSLHDWNDFKKKENLEEELDQHRRSKDSFIERQAFLGRTDLREFEREKSIRDHERKVRELNKAQPKWKDSS